MKKPILTAALAFALGAGATTPAYASDSYSNSFTCIPVEVLIGLLRPVVQAIRR